mmetsp:Transcript_20756/g.63552  ORF Transcript_20756/g.63552 Transcript_20756/m.63552 type:complete len:120 (+) Transcript_20756:2203-2562(+)
MRRCAMMSGATTIAAVTMAVVVPSHVTAITAAAPTRATVTTAAAHTPVTVTTAAVPTPVAATIPATVAEVVALTRAAATTTAVAKRGKCTAIISYDFSPALLATFFALRLRRDKKAKGT